MHKRSLKETKYNIADPVALLPCSDYDPAAVRAALDEGLKLLGDHGIIGRPGERVLLKPNLLRAAHPEAAVTTHPVIVEAAINAVRAAGAEPLVGDSPSYGSFERVAEVSGLAEVCRRLQVPIFALDDPVPLQLDGGARFRRLEVARAVLEVDRVVNLAKAKTHQQMLLTLGVKNLFGCVYGLEKARWHFKAGTDARHFARMIAELAAAVGADLTVLDAVVGMDGDGPGGGRVRPMGFLALGRNPFAVDVVTAGLFGIPPERVPVLAAGRELGLAPARAADVEILGVGDWRELAIPDFRLPGAAKVGWSLPRPIFRLLKRLFTPQPKIDRERCTLCGDCVDVCPADAMTNAGGRIEISYRDCINCYCCAEVCPHSAVNIR